MTKRKENPQNVRDLSARFAKFTRQSGDCLIWTGQRTKGGYGHITIRGRCLFAHRVHYEMHRGPIPEGLHLDHLCKTPSCVNPAHLEPVTVRENLMRSDNFIRINAEKTHCLRGHEFTPDNVWMNGGRRHCRQCRLLRDRQRRARQKAQRLLPMPEVLAEDMPVVADRRAA